ncbi:MAG: flagellar capping protein, partial [Lachnospiraceae bacterium]|nr:flagellar capping protein [Lachnospiraceae bacterium]
MARIDAAYNYYLSTYNPRGNGSKYDIHKKSELRAAYNQMLKANKESPLYKINMDDETVKNFAIDLKENARAAKNIIAEISSNGDSIESLLDKKVAASSNDEFVSVNYVGNESSETSPSFDMQVNSLASPQINTGNFLDSNRYDFEDGHYSFDLNTTTNSFEFQFNVNIGDNNLDVQKKLARLVNSSDVGLKAEIVTSGENRSALQLTSKNTGLPEGANSLFSIETDTSWAEINRLGIDRITHPASNSSFTLNNTDHSSMSNTFTINKAFEVTIHKPTQGESVNVGFKTNTQALADSVDDLVNVYNNMVQIGANYSVSHNNSYFNEMTGIGRTLSNQLSDIGISQTE